MQCRSSMQITEDILPLILQVLKAENGSFYCIDRLNVEGGQKSVEEETECQERLGDFTNPVHQGFEGL